MSDPPTLKRALDFGPAIVRICCATAVGALVGAPLGALAIHEDILKKMYEAAIVTGLTATAAEIYEPLSALTRRDTPPAEPVTNSDIYTAIDYTVFDELLRPGSCPIPTTS